MAIDPATKIGARALERLATDRIAWLTTVAADGQPQSMPIWFLWEPDAGEILMYSQAGAIRNANLQANPKVSFHFSDDGSGGDIVSIDGEARFDEDGPRGKDHPAYLAKYGDWLKENDWTPEYFELGLPAPGADPPDEGPRRVRRRRAAGLAAVSAGVRAGVAAAGALAARPVGGWLVGRTERRRTRWAGRRPRHRHRTRRRSTRRCSSRISTPTRSSGAGTSSSAATVATPDVPRMVEGKRRPPGPRGHDQEPAPPQPRPERRRQR